MKKTLTLLISIIALQLSAQFDFIKKTIASNTVYNNELDIADFDGNGELDIIVISYGQDLVSIYFNKKGQYEKKIIVNSKDQPSSIKATDIDKDGDIDFLLGAKGDYIYAYLNDGKGIAFEEIASAKYSGSTILDIKLADFNNDGFDDIIATYSPGDIKMFINNGNADFDRYGVDADIKRPGDITIIDFDNDGDLDLLSPSFFGTGTYLYINNGSTIPTFAKFTIDNTINAPSNIFVFDLNGDSRNDVIVGGFNDNKLYWFDNKSSGFVKKVVDGFIGKPTEIYVEDLNKDGKSEIICYGQTDKVINAYTTFDNGVSFEKVILDNSGTLNGWMKFTDWDNDDDVDILISGSSTLVYFENQLLSSSVTDGVLDKELTKVFPNPTNGLITALDPSIHTIEVKTIAGTVIEKFNSNQIDLSKFSSGLYLLTLMNGTRAENVLVNKQ